MGSDDTATTYEKICPETTTTTPAPSSTDDAWYYDSPAEQSSKSASYSSALAAWISYYETALPAQTPTTGPKSCDPFTMIQGPETWAFHKTVSEYTSKADATWTGVMTEVPITVHGEFFNGTETIYASVTNVIQQSELREWPSPLYAVATVVEATTSPTPANTEDLDGALEAGTQAAGSEGKAPSASLPTGAMLVIGGAAAIGGAAWAF
ncbi:unnamed protein product [Alternaria sp. RS040]